MPSLVMSVLLNVGLCHISAVADGMCMMPGAVAQELAALQTGKTPQKINATEQVLVMANTGKVRV